MNVKIRDMIIYFVHYDCYLLVIVRDKQESHRSEYLDFMFQNLEDDY